MRLLAWMVCCGMGLAQAGDLTVVPLQMVGKSPRGKDVSEISVPYVKASQGASAQRQAVVRKINDRLFIEQFAILAPCQVQAKLAVTKGMDIEGVANQSVKVLRNDNRVLTIALEREWCGAYCEVSNDYYQFDQQNGALLLANDVLTDNGKLQLQRWMRQKRIAAYQQQLKLLAQERKTSKLQKGKKAMRTMQTSKTALR